MRARGASARALTALVLRLLLDHELLELLARDVQPRDLLLQHEQRLLVRRLLRLQRGRRRVHARAQQRALRAQRGDAVVRRGPAHLLGAQVPHAHPVVREHVRRREQRALELRAHGARPAPRVEHVAQQLAGVALAERARAHARAAAGAGPHRLPRREPRAQPHRRRARHQRVVRLLDQILEVVRPLLEEGELLALLLRGEDEHREGLLEVAAEHGLHQLVQVDLRAVQLKLALGARSLEHAAEARALARARIRVGDLALALGGRRVCGRIPVICIATLGHIGVALAPALAPRLAGRGRRIHGRFCHHAGEAGPPDEMAVVTTTRLCPDDQ